VAADGDDDHRKGQQHPGIADRHAHRRIGNMLAKPNGGAKQDAADDEAGGQAITGDGGDHASPCGDGYAIICARQGVRVCHPDG
jgi:hypothetical protein